MKVALCGDGGDELFGGYERFGAALALARYRDVIPSPARSGVRSVAEAAAPVVRGGASAKALRALRRSDLPVPMALLAWVSCVPAERKAELVGDAHRAGMDAYRRIWEQSAGAHPLDRLLHLNLSSYLLDDLLPKVDRMAMAHGLEVRSPFLDRELAELAFRLPPGARVRGMSLSAS